MRSASNRWPPKYQVLNDAFVGKQINKATGRLAKHFRCAKCQEVFPAKEVQVNHISPVIPVTGFDSWDATIERLFCEADGLEVLCIPCHKIQTQLENDERKNLQGL